LNDQSKDGLTEDIVMGGGEENRPWFLKMIVMIFYGNVTEIILNITTKNFNKQTPCGNLKTTISEH